MAARRRSAREPEPLQFESQQEATCWTILVGPLAADSDDLNDAADDADELILLWRRRRRALDDVEPPPEEDD